MREKTASAWRKNKKYKEIEKQQADQTIGLQFISDSIS
jgi:hypothetical protein